MKVKTLSSVLFLMLLSPIAGCVSLETASHKYLMRGQILEMKGDTAYLCIGSNDGTQIGQEFTVYKFERRPHIHKNAVSFKRKKTGIVKIVQVIDEHVATAEIVSGEAKENYVVELNP